LESHNAPSRRRLGIRTTMGWYGLTLREGQVRRSRKGWGEPALGPYSATRFPDASRRRTEVDRAVASGTAVVARGAGSIGPGFREWSTRGMLPRAGRSRSNGPATTRSRD